jgi:hypothetical protein
MVLAIRNRHSRLSGKWVPVSIVGCQIVHPRFGAGSVSTPANSGIRTSDSWSAPAEPAAGHPITIQCPATIGAISRSPRRSRWVKKSHRRTAGGKDRMPPWGRKRTPGPGREPRASHKSRFMKQDQTINLIGFYWCGILFHENTAMDGQRDRLGASQPVRAANIRWSLRVQYQSSAPFVLNRGPVYHEAFLDDPRYLRELCALRELRDKWGRATNTNPPIKPPPPTETPPPHHANGTPRHGPARPPAITAPQPGNAPSRTGTARGNGTRTAD